MLKVVDVNRLRRTKFKLAYNIKYHQISPGLYAA